MSNLRRGAAPDAVTAPGMAAFAGHLADLAREISLSAFRRDLHVQHKADDSPVTAIDRSIEAMIRREIATAFPDHGILGEEHGRAHLDAEHVWVVDPIDGTRSFISGWPLWGTLIALLHHGKPVLGLVDIPFLDERWTGAPGQATLYNGRPVQTRDCRTLADATVYCTSPDIFTPDERAAFERVTAAAQTRRFGGDCYSYAMLASGHLDAVVEAQLQPYDYLSLAPVIEGAGGVITGWHGEPLGMEGSGRVVAAATPELHRQILEKLA
ncbi:histidinol-phosphatase [Pinirhizobacter soli]|uniref:histidinol-phosphatase n=1 Tax=Pinirhizobacter soli TaxID=2786953 RepID=UPI00202A5C11|nr:histidinol-phosphatase [Pinirhizobacter soli]